MIRIVLFPLVLFTFGCDGDGIEPPSTRPAQPAPSDAMNNDWPFEDPPNVATITLTRIMQEDAPILYVTHDQDDGGWQFLDGGEISTDDAMVVSLASIVKRDPSVKELADLPLGWIAERDAPGEPWRRSPHE